MSLPAVETPQQPAGLARRLASMTYEGVVLFGVVFMAAYLYGTLTQQRHALQGQMGLQGFLFLIIGMYFTWFWSRSGQTVAMKAWGIQVVDQHGRRISQIRALCRYLASWLWVAPGLLTAWLVRPHQPAFAVATVAICMATYATLARLHPRRQFLHDVLCHTELVQVDAHRPMAIHSG
ncbi:MAG: RDD family protein [Aquabacterium sp.]